MSADGLRDKVLGGVLVAVVAGTALVSVLRWVDLSRPALVPAAQSLTPVAGVVAALLLAGCLLLQRWRLAAVAGAVSLLHLLVAAPHVLTNTVDPGDDDVIVVAANLQQGQAQAVAMADAVHQNGVDVLVLTEVTEEALKALDDDGLEALLPHRAGTTAQGVRGTLVLSSYPLTVQAPIEATFHQPVVRVERPQGAFTLAGVHSAAPTTERWRGDLSKIAAWRAERPQGPLVIAGDFNAGANHPGFREAADGMTDAHEAAGGGWVRTWPKGWWVPAWAHLDHVLVQDVDVVSAGTVDVPGSDHAAVWARLSF